VSGASIPLVWSAPGSADPAVYEKFPHLTGFPVLRLAAGDLAMVPELLTGQVAVAMSAGGLRLNATGLQIPGVLDDLYAAGATGAELGVAWAGEVPTVRLWAPTAKSVSMQVFDGEGDVDATVVPMTVDPASGVWSAVGDATWKGKEYVYAVEVYVPALDAVTTNIVTDPYSVSLTTNSQRSRIVDLADPALEPDGWDAVAKPPLAQPEDIVLYELHVRDFSATDESVPEELRGTFGAFALEDTDGTSHLEALAEAGLTHVHLLPAFDIATVNEDRSTWQSPSFDELAALPPDSEEQQNLVTATQDLDGFNWGYDPWHYTVPEGSYSTDPEGEARVVEFREMVKALNADGLRVVMDVVYNHTTAAGQDPKSVLDRVVPGYYHRLDDKGVIATSTCCPNTASEHDMMEKLMVDSLVTWARAYKVDGFRFDLMGHHSKANMQAVREALDALTLDADGVDGSSIYLYGEGWNFGEVANDVRFEQATQSNMAGTGVGTFNDRLRDAVRGGGPFDGGDALVVNQGLVNGLWYDPNASGGPFNALDELLLSADQVRVGLAGNLADFEFVDRNGNVVTGSQVDYNGSPAGYTADPQENIVYVEAHDNQTLFDISQYKHPLDTSMDDRVRAQNLGMDYTLLAQGVPFVHAGMELLRSKSMDRDSYNSGDWFNRLDWTFMDNGWASGLPVADKNADNWYLIGPRLADPALDPDQAHILAARDHLLDLLEIRQSSPLFRLSTEELVQERLAFANTGPDQVPGLVVMTLTDPGLSPLPTGDLDPAVDGLVVLFNATDESVSYQLPAVQGANIVLHPVQASSSDAVVGTAGFDPASGTFTVPARTTAVFVDQESEPPTMPEDLIPISVQPGSGWFQVPACTDNVTEDPDVVAAVNGVPVSEGMLVRLVQRPGKQHVVRLPGFVLIQAPSFEFTATCTDDAGNSTTVSSTVVFAPRGRPGG
jgi:pullulanase